MLFVLFTRFCRACINSILSKLKPTCPYDGEALQHNQIFPDKCALNEILALKIYCPQRNFGCQWIGKFVGVGEHEKDCPFVEVECLNAALGCKEQVRRYQLAKHVEKECQYNEVECRYCAEKLAEAVLVKHYQDCLKYPVTCPHECGLEDITRQELAEHIKICARRPEPCSFCSIGCTFEGPKEAVMDHLTYSQSEHLLLSNQQLELTNLKMNELQLEVGSFREKYSTLQTQLETLNETLAFTKQTLSSQQVKLGQVEKYVASQKEMFSEFRLKLERIGSSSSSQEATRNVNELQEKMCAQERKLTNIEHELGRIRGSSSGMESRFQSLNLSNTPLDRRADRLEHSMTLHDIQLAEHDLKIQILQATSYDGVFLWKIDDYTRRFHEAATGRTPSLYSPPFYTSRFGYKVCARLYLHGDGIGKDHFLSLFFVIMKGEYDALLSWPFRQKVTLKLLDHERVQDITETFRPDPNSSSFQRPRSEMNIASGCPQFCSHSVLKSGPYVREDTIFVKITVDTTGLATI